MAKFRFQDLRIWQLAIQIANELLDIADDLEKRKFYRFAEQLRAAGMSMSNNIAEGSGSSSKKEFIQFLNIARRSTFENANILIVLEMRGILTKELLDKLLEKLDILCRQITSFQKSLK
jgi:four helix bundle protein